MICILCRGGHRIFPGGKVPEFEASEKNLGLGEFEREKNFLPPSEKRWEGHGQILFYKINFKGDFYELQTWF